MSSLSLTGPCITMDTACSSSMAALHTAVKDLESGACKYAIVAGKLISFWSSESVYTGISRVMMFHMFY